MKLSEADKVKLRKLKKVKELQHMFKEIVEANNKENDHLARLTPEEMVVDPAYRQAYLQRIENE